jgi:hypothetical protein
MYWVNTMLVLKFWQQQISFISCEDRYLNLKKLGSALLAERSLIGRTVLILSYTITRINFPRNQSSNGKQIAKAYMLATT